MAGSEVKRYRSKPVEVEAMLVTKTNHAEVAAWCGGYVGGTATGRVCVATINGGVYANEGHYVVKGPNDFYPCDPDTFASRWEQI